MMQSNNIQLPLWIDENQQQFNLPNPNIFDGYTFTDEFQLKNIQLLQSNNIKVQRWIAENQVLSFSPSPILQEMQYNFDSEESLPYLDSQEQSFQCQDITESTDLQDQHSYYSSEEWQSSDLAEYLYSDSEEELNSYDSAEQNFQYQEMVQPIQDCYYSFELKGSDEVFQMVPHTDALEYCSQFQNQTGSSSEDQYWSDADSCSSGWISNFDLDYFIC